MAKEQLGDWVAETSASIVARLEAAKSSQRQTRVTLGIMAIISAMLLIASYNAYFSYDYRYLTKNLKRPLGTQTMPDVMMGQAARDWTAARTIQNALLGIRVSVDDAVLGTAVLAVLSLWLVLVTRRENHTIGLLLRATDTEQDDGDSGSHSRSSPRKYSNDQRWLIFHTIAANALFETPDTSMASISSLGGPNPLTARVGGLKGLENQYGFRMIRSFFFLFPVITSVVVFCVDRYSYFVPDPFDPNGSIPGIEDPFFWPSMAGYVMLIPLAVCCLKASRFSRATESVLREYCVKLFEDLA
jgi:hypothetical protein